MNQQNLKIAFIGVGGIAGNYRRSLKQLERPIAAVCDINAERVAAIATEENATAYTDHNEMLQKENPDVVFTCIPPGAHTTQVADAAASGAALFVAKPVAQDLETAQRARDAIDTAGVINQVGYMARYSDITAKAKELVGDQKLAMGFGRFLARWVRTIRGGENTMYRADRWWSRPRTSLTSSAIFLVMLQASMHPGSKGSLRISPILRSVPSVTCNLRVAQLGTLPAPVSPAHTTVSQPNWWAMTSTSNSRTTSDCGVRLAVRELTTPARKPVTSDRLSSSSMQLRRTTKD